MTASVLVIDVILRFSEVWFYGWRVWRPTVGRVVVRGRVAPLLSLAAGFHPDMSGRENILINATILGYGRRVVEERTPEAIAFSEIGDFIDQL